MTDRILASVLFSCSLHSPWLHCGSKVLKYIGWSWSVFNNSTSTFAIIEDFENSWPWEQFLLVSVQKDWSFSENLHLLIDVDSGRNVSGTTLTISLRTLYLNEIASKKNSQSFYSIFLPLAFTLAYYQYFVSISTAIIYCLALKY